MVRIVASYVVAASIVASQSSTSCGQQVPNVPQIPQAALASTPFSRSTSQMQPPLNSTTRNVLNFYGATRAAATLRQIPRPPAVTTATAASRIQLRAASYGANSGPTRRSQKPFATDNLPPTVSPYLNLYRPNENEAAPNYFAFVRPQLQQQEINQRHQAEIRRLRRQVQQQSTALGMVPRDQRGFPTTGHGTRFMDLGGFFSR